MSQVPEAKLARLESGLAQHSDEFERIYRHMDDGFSSLRQELQHMRADVRSQSQPKYALVISLSAVILTTVGGFGGFAYGTLGDRLAVHATALERHETLVGHPAMEERARFAAEMATVLAEHDRVQAIQIARLEALVEGK